MPETLYSITQIVQQTGIPSQTIYAWERRYHALTPNRTEKGRRVYTATQLARLKLLKACVEQGSRIGTIAHLRAASLDGLLVSSKHRPASLPDLVGNALALDQDKIDSKVGSALMGLGAGAFADEFLSPFLADVSAHWQNERGRIAAEHVVSASAKSALFAALRINRPRVSKRCAAFATPEGELHELGLLAAAVTAQSCGVRAVYFGSQMPIQELSSAAQVAGADLIVFASSLLEPEELAGQAQELRRKIPRSMELAFGGAGI